MQISDFNETEIEVLGDTIQVIIRPISYHKDLNDAYAIFIPNDDEIVFNKDSFEDLSEKDYKRVFRHEIIHAFREKAGGRDADCFPEGEELIVEFFAQMFPKMFNIFKELDILE